MSKKSVFSVFLFLLAATAIYLFLLRDDDFIYSGDSMIIASVEDKYLTENDLSGMLSNPEVDSYKIKIFVENWINREILAQESENSGLINNDELMKILSNYRREILANLYLEENYRRIPRISDSEILDFYNENIENYVRDKKEIRAYHFLTESVDAAIDLKRAIISGDEERMATLLTKYNGTLRTFGRNDVIEEISTAAFGSRKDVVGPIETDYGYHVLQILDRFDEESLIPVHEMRDEIIQKIKIQKQNLIYYQLLDSLRLSSGYYINESYFE